MKLSVVIPAYNRASLLPATLRSLLAQERVADEILVVDDGSTDDTADVAEAFGGPVRVIRQSNQGPAAARNRGLSEAQGEYIHFFDSDDLASTRLHLVQLDALHSTGADLAFSPWVKVKLNPTRGVQPTNHVLQARGMPRGPLVRALLTNWSVVPICWLIRRSLVTRCGGFPVFLRVAEDQLFFLRLLLQGARVVHTPGTLVLYRDEDHEKLTGIGEDVAGRHQLEWARFLLSARAECLAAGIDPSRWFGFRRRAFLAAMVLRKMADPPIHLLHELDSIYQSHNIFDGFYRPSRMIQQKGESLTARLLGRRAHRSFQARAMTASQHALAATAASHAGLYSHTLNRP